MAKENHDYDPDPTPLATALAKLIPKTCLPSAFDDYQDLADHLTIELSGTLALVPKEQYDRLIATTQAPSIFVDFPTV
jgi:hypothetical protein